MAKFQALKGFRDFYPEEFARRQHVFDVWRRVARRHGFVEYDAPPLEALALYQQKSGDEIEGQLYAFEDKGGRSVALRPEMTPSVARMVAARWQSLPKPIKWFSIPQLFRYERPQAGRLREHFQLNADIFGDPRPIADAQLLALVVDIFKEFGLTSDDVEIRVSDRRVLNLLLLSVGLNQADFEVVYRVLDKLDRQDHEVSVSILLDAGISQRCVNEIFGMVARVRTLTSSNEPFSQAPAALDSANSFTAIGYYLGQLVSDFRAWITFDLSIVRGLDYYTGTVFEAFDRRGRFRAICGGGRYDNLLHSVGGATGAAVGVGWGDVVFTDLLLQEGHAFPIHRRVDWLVLSSLVEDASATVVKLRSLGYNADFNTYTGPQLSSTMIASTKFVLVLGDHRPSLIDTRTNERWNFASPSGFVAKLESMREQDNALASDGVIRELATKWHLEHNYP
jgi:histidyl-tRNA synthetase